MSQLPELPTQSFVFILRSQALVSFSLSTRISCSFGLLHGFKLVMSESKDGTAARGPTAAPGGLALNADSAPKMQSGNHAVGAASSQGYLSKLLGSGFGFGSATAPSVTDRTPATVEEYHPGNGTARHSHVAPGDGFKL